MKIWLKAGGLIAAIWLIAALAIHFAHGRQPTVASITDYVNSTDLNSLSAADRQRAIARMEDMLNRVSLEDRQQLDRARITRDFFDKLTADEQGAYLDATLPTGFKEMMESFNKMDPVKRKQFVSRALEQMKQRQGDGPPPDPKQAQIAQHVIDQGLKSFYSDASADTKLDLAPLVEQMQENLQMRDHP
jgi:hypothetical protein